MKLKTAIEDGASVARRNSRLHERPESIEMIGSKA